MFLHFEKSGRGLHVKRVTLISSTGGHWTQLNNIYKEFKKIESIENKVKIKLITEKMNLIRIIKKLIFFINKIEKVKI